MHKLLIFDLDGTLIDSLADLTDATNHMLGSFGRETLTPPEVRKLGGQGARNLVERAMPGAAGREVDEGLSFSLPNEDHIADRRGLSWGGRDLARLRDDGA
jgi:phosphoglycolate phosphatase